MTIDTTKEAVETALHPLIRMVADGYMLSEKEVSGILETMRALRAELDKLQDPNAVHIAMLSGRITKPSVAQIKHIYAGELE